MSSLTFNKYIPLTERESGEKAYPIWLLINPKYPTVVHDIWRHVLDVIQDKVYRELHTRIDTTNIYVRSAVSDCGIVPNTLNCMFKPSFIGILEIRPDVPFSQVELHDLPTDVAALMFMVLGGNPTEEEFVIKITCPNLDDPDEKEINTISESWMSGEMNFKHYSIFTGRFTIMPSG